MQLSFFFFMKSQHFVTYCNFRKMYANLDFTKFLQTAPVERYRLVPDTSSKTKHAPVSFYKWNVFHNNMNELDTADNLN